MPTSTRFAVATHILSFLAIDRSTPKTSEQIAESLSTNPVIVRRLLQDLTRAGLTKTELGKGGGAKLSKGPKRITLIDIYQAVETSGLISMPRSQPSAKCLIGRNIEPVLQNVVDRAEQAFLAELASHTLKDLVKSIKSAEAA